MGKINMNDIIFYKEILKQGKKEPKLICSYPREYWIRFAKEEIRKIG
ncbi:hypothetical protein [Aquimarina addita]